MEDQSKKTVRTFALASFFNDFGSDIIYPIWPLFVTTVLKADMAVLGLIDGLGDAIVSISQAISGYVSDRIQKRKVFVWTGYLFGSLSRFGYGIATVWQHLIPFRILDRAGKMRGAPRDAIVADVSTDQNRGANFGFLRTMDNLGAVAGIITSIVLLGPLGYRNLFMLAAIPSAIGGIMILLVVKETRSTGKEIFKGFSLKYLDKNFALLLALSAFFALGAFSYSFLLVFAEQFGFQASSVPVLYLIFTVVASVFSLPFGKVSDRVGRKQVMLIGFLLWALTCLVAVVNQSQISIILLFVLYGLHKAAIEPVQKTLVSELAPVEYRASTLGGFQMVVGLCALPASLVAGLLWDRVSIYSPFYLSLGLTVVAMVLLIAVREKRKG